jgi:hypothetical protein
MARVGSFSRLSIDESRSELIQYSLAKSTRWKYPILSFNKLPDSREFASASKAGIQSGGGLEPL